MPTGIVMMPQTLGRGICGVCGIDAVNGASTSMSNISPQL
jgi:hypothetical protein